MHPDRQGTTRPRLAVTIRVLDLLEVPALAALEIAAWPVPLRANEELIRERLTLGHTMLVAATSGHLVAAACFVATAELPFDAARFPRDFAHFSSLPRSDPVRSVYVYNLCVHPAQRGGIVVRQVIDAVIASARALGARWLVGDGRCPSYAGTDGEGLDKIRADTKFRAALDAWTAKGERPPLDVLLRDPVLRFYHRVLRCRFLHLAPNFVPNDTSSGGYRVIFARDLQDERDPPV